MNNDLHEKFGTQTAQTCYLFIYLFFLGGGGGGWGRKNVQASASFLSH